MRTGLDVARAIALGQPPVAQARPSGFDRRTGGANAFLDRWNRLRATMLLVGAQTVEHLRSAPRIILGDPKTWLAQ